MRCPWSGPLKLSSSEHRQIEIRHNTKVCILRIDWRRLNRSDLSIAWLFSAGIIAVLLFTRNFWFAAAGILIVIIGSIRLWRGFSLARGQISWKRALHTSGIELAHRQSIDPDKPFFALIVEGQWAGRCASLVPGEDSGDWKIHRGPAEMEAAPTDSELADSEDSVKMGALRFLPQGPLSDEIWRRNFDSLRRGSRFRALPGTQDV